DPKRRSVPWQGPREDSAHPSIFPTGEIPHGKLSDQEWKVYEIIVRRFCNTFASDALLEKTVAIFDVSSSEFQSEGTRVLEQGWMRYYNYSFSTPETLNVALIVGEEFDVRGAAISTIIDPQPSRYSEGSLLAKMEGEKIGTKATRAETISTLIKRFYVKKMKNELVPSLNGISLIETLRNHSPDIVSSEMTRNLETKLNQLQSAKAIEEEIVIQIISVLRNSLKNITGIEKLDWASLSSQEERVTPRKSLGPCPTCKIGNLQLIKSRKSGKRFIGCSNFAKGCKASSPALPRGIIKSTGRSCLSCGWPVISVSFSHHSTKESCANFFCDSRKIIATSFER
ncbi:MAG: DNA topoisomerase, partial [Thaumarchaeota archaeon]|nr:DNA topoisomerase [Nitrososphaerota archaeon]